jgi:hypothetical protein
MLPLLDIIIKIQATLKFYFECSMNITMKIIIYLLLTFLIAVTGISSDLRLRSLGNARLALLDTENEFNLYRYSYNPAYLLFDEHQDWLKFYGGSNYYHTSFKRLYDPEKEQNVYFNFIGYKILSPNQAIWGKVSYSFNNKYHLPYALERYPYADDPLVLADTTIGNILSDGPTIEIAYHYQPWSKLGLGLGIVYDISTGLKEQYTRPRTIHRNFEGKLAFTYHLSPQLIIGSWLNGAFLQDQIELTKSWDGKDIYTRRYRSEWVYRGVLAEFDRYINLNSWHYNLAAQYIRKNFHNVLSFDYVLNIQEVADKAGTNRRLDSQWYQRGFRLNYRTRLFISKYILGLQGSYLAQDDWSEHPDLPILITDRSRNVYELGIGISLPVKFLLLVGELGYQQTEENYHDYQSQITRQGKNEGFTGIAGCEIVVDPIHSLRFGYNHYHFEPGFESPQYLPEYRGQYLSVGLAEVRSPYELEIHFDYNLKNSAQDDYSYYGWNGLLYTRIFIR